MDPAAAWQRFTTRAATKGDIQVDLLVARVWSWNKAETTARQWFLVVRRELDATEEIMYSLSDQLATGNYKVEFDGTSMDTWYNFTITLTLLMRTW